jgi:hypothetical protein
VIVVLVAQAFYLPSITGINEVLYFLAGGSGIKDLFWGEAEKET